MFRVMIFIPNRKIVSKYKNMQLQERIKKKTISFPCSIAIADVKLRLTLLRALNFRSELRATAAIAKDNTVISESLNVASFAKLLKNCDDKNTLQILL